MCSVLSVGGDRLRRRDKLSVMFQFGVACRKVLFPDLKKCPRTCLPQLEQTEKAKEMFRNVLSAEPKSFPGAYAHLIRTLRNQIETEKDAKLKLKLMAECEKWLFAWIDSDATKQAYYACMDYFVAHHSVDKMTAVWTRWISALTGDADGEFEGAEDAKSNEDAFNTKKDAASGAHATTASNRVRHR